MLSKAKLAVGIGTSFLDPINIGASFVPIYGQLRFARSIAKAKSMGVKSSKAFRNTRSQASHLPPELMSEWKRVKRMVYFVRKQNLGESISNGLPTDLSDLVIFPRNWGPWASGQGGGQPA